MTAITVNVDASCYMQTLRTLRHYYVYEQPYQKSLSYSTLLPPKPHQQKLEIAKNVAAKPSNTRVLF